MEEYDSSSLRVDGLQTSHNGVFRSITLPPGGWEIIFSDIFTFLQFTTHSFMPLWSRHRRCAGAELVRTGHRRRPLTFAHRPVVAPGCKHFGHSLAADGFAALENVVLSAAELHLAADAANKHTGRHAG